MGPSLTTTTSKWRKRRKKNGIMMEKSGRRGTRTIPRSRASLIILNHGGKDYLGPVSSPLTNLSRTHTAQGSGSCSRSKVLHIKMGSLVCLVLPAFIYLDKCSHICSYQLGTLDWHIHDDLPGNYLSFMRLHFSKQGEHRIILSGAGALFPVGLPACLP